MKMKRILINDSYGGWGISDEALEMFKERIAPHVIPNLSTLSDWILRQDETLIEIFLEKGSDFVSATYAHLELVEIPENAYYRVLEFDGMETLIWSNSEIHFGRIKRR